MTNVSNHGKERLKKRAGIKKKSAQKISDRAWEQGIMHNELNGNLKKWVDSHVIDSKATPRIYMQKLFLFSHDKILITIINVPANLHKRIPKRNMHDRTP